jgi:release factor glutamine methyltransferase
LDAGTLLAHITGKPRAWLYAHAPLELSADQRAALEAALQRLESGEPLPYVLGRWEFYRLDFAVSPAALIPRPETEILVEAALAWLRANPERRRAADVGVGAGCIAVTLAKLIPDLRLLAVDISMEALRLARLNAVKHGVGARVAFLQADLLRPVGEQKPLDLICANLPYISSEFLSTLRVAHSEPRLALDGGPDGLALIRRLIERAPALLAPGGMLLLEIDFTQGEIARRLAREAFPQAEIDVETDFAGLERVLIIQQTLI